MRLNVVPAAVFALLVVSVAWPCGDSRADAGRTERADSAARLARHHEAKPRPELVRRAQAVLIAAGRLKGKPDGKMNPATRTAIRSYQKQHGLKITGTLSRETLAFMGIPPDTAARP